MLHAMIMAGGGGTRFWPRSRHQRPKQFLTMTGDRSLIQLAFDRVDACAIPAERTHVITADAYREETGRHLPALSPERIVGEPVGRDTAPCIGLAAALVAREDPDATLLVTPADHVIEPVQQFRAAVHVAVQLADEHPSALITFGIPPTFPSTGYGYIHRGDVAACRQGIDVFHVRGFREKPASDLAERFVASGEYYWNSGIFVWKAAAVLDEMRRQRPALYDSVRRIADARDTPRWASVLGEEYAKVEKVSIDYAVMEHAKEVLAVQAPYLWDDVGSWLALERMNPQDADGNTVMATHCGMTTKNCVIVGDPGRLIATVGVHELLIVQDGDATLVADRRDEGTIKQLVELLKKKGLEKYL
jgi:mannose-1-phosphate guanylyltransferase